MFGEKKVIADESLMIWQAAQRLHCFHTVYDYYDITHENVELKFIIDNTKCERLFIAYLNGMPTLFTGCYIGRYVNEYNTNIT